MPFNFGAFAGGLSQGMREGQKMQLEAEAHKLKAKMLDAQMKAMEFDQQEKQRKVAEQANQQIELGKYVDMLGKGVQQGGAPGYESEQQQMSVAPVPEYRPANQGELLSQAVKTVPPEHRYNLIQQSMKPATSAMTRPVKPGDFVPDPNDPSGYRQIGQPKPETPQRPISVAPGGTVINPKTGQPMFSAPNKPEKPERPITVAPGGTVLDPSTGKPIFTAPERKPTPGKDVPPIANFKNAKQQLEAMAGKYKTKDLQRIKPELEASANQLGYTIQGVRPGIIGWNIDIAPVAPSKRGSGGSDIDSRLNKMFGQ